MGERRDRAPRHRPQRRVDRDRDLVLEGAPVTAAAQTTLRAALEAVQRCERAEDELFQRVPSSGPDLPLALLEMARLKRATANALTIAYSVAIDVLT